MINFSFFRYESEFFLNVVHGRDIVSWGAVDRNRSDGHSDELIGFVTARLVMAKGSEVSPLFICMLAVNFILLFPVKKVQNHDLYLIVYTINCFNSSTIC